MPNRTTQLTIVLISLFTLGACGSNIADTTSADTSTTTPSAKDVTFLAQLEISSDTVFTDGSYDIRARVWLKHAATRVVVEQVSSDDPNAATVITELSAMNDAADLDFGDDIARDHVYHAMLSFTETQPGYIYLRANVDGVYSEIRKVTAFDRYTDEEWDAILNRPNDAKAYFESLSGTNAEKSAATVQWLLENRPNNGVAIAGVAEDGRGVWIVYASGALGGFTPDAPTDPDAPLYRSGPLSYRNDSQQQERESRTHFPINAQCPMPRLETSAAARPLKQWEQHNTITSNSALLLAPYKYEFKEHDDSVGSWITFQQLRCPSFHLTAKMDHSPFQQSITPNDFKNLSEHGVVIIASHGTYWYNGARSVWRDYYGGHCEKSPLRCNPFTDDLEQVIIYTGYRIPQDGLREYEEDLKQQRLAVAHDGTYAITPKFITHYNGTFPNSLIWLGSCQSVYNDTMANAFLHNGAQTVLGFDRLVDNQYAFNLGRSFFGTQEGLFDFSMDVSAGDAMFSAQVKHGFVDPRGPARLQLRGNEDVHLNVFSLNNANFESGDTSGWTGSGDYHITFALGDIAPSEGAYMGAISTGLPGPGTEQLTTSSLSQNLCIPAGVTTLSYEYNVISEEPMCYVSSEYDDTFTMTLLDPDTKQELAIGSHESINTSEWSFLGGDYFAAGDDYSSPQTCSHEPEKLRDDGTYHTGWKTGSIDVSAFAGQSTPAQIHFQITDEGDHKWDTAVVIDNIVLE